MKQTTAWAVAAVTASVVLIITVFSLGIIAGPAIDNGRTVLTLQPKTVATMKGAVYEALGDVTGREVPKVQAIDISKSSNGSQVEIRFAINGNGADDLSATDVQADVRNVLKALYQNDIALTSVQLTGTYPTTQPSGVVMEIPVLKCTLSAKQASDIHWDTISSDELFYSLTSVWCHPSISAK